MNNVVQIHGKSYMTVAGRLEEAKKDLKSINTEVIAHETMVIIKATVTTTKGIFTGISAANPSKQIEKQSPYEVAETSAVGRALGFAGYGVIDGIASADEMNKSGATDEKVQKFLDSQKHCSNPECPNKQFEVPEKVIEYSKSKYGQVLCYRCQKERGEV